MNFYKGTFNHPLDKTRVLDSIILGSGSAETSRLDDFLILQSVGSLAVTLPRLLETDLAWFSAGLKHTNIPRDIRHLCEKLDTYLFIFSV